MRPSSAGRQRAFPAPSTPVPWQGPSQSTHVGKEPDGEASAGGQVGGVHQGPGAAAAAVVGDDGIEEVRIIERVGVREWI